MKRQAVYPGSFDPVTSGHLDIIKRASGIFEKLNVAVLNNSGKNPLFSLEERVALLKKVTAGLPNVSVGFFEGLTVDYARSIGAGVIIRGMRAISDFENEFKMAMANKTMASEIETIFLFSSLENMFLSSSVIKEIALFGGDISSMVPEEILSDIKLKFGGGKV
jgi:pantetheine-phosphate adenylyltransferase